MSTLALAPRICRSSEEDFSLLFGIALGPLVAFPLYPMSRCWSLYIGQHEYGKVTAANINTGVWQPGGIFKTLYNWPKDLHHLSQLYRGALPLISAVGLRQIGCIPVYMSTGTLVRMKNKEPLEAKSIALATIIGYQLAFEALIQPLRYAFFVQSSLPVTYDKIYSFHPATRMIINQTIHQYGLRGLFIGFGPSLFSSQILLTQTALWGSKSINAYAFFALSVPAYIFHMFSARMAIAAYRSPSLKYNNIFQAITSYAKSSQPFRGMTTGFIGFYVTSILHVTLTSFMLDFYPKTKMDG